MPLAVSWLVLASETTYLKPSVFFHEQFSHALNFFEIKFRIQASITHNNNKGHTGSKVLS